MINYENQIFSNIYAQAIAQFPTLTMKSEVEASPAKFPFVSLVEVDNTTLQRSLTSALGENHVNVTYELSVYSNKQTGKKSECRQISSFIDTLLLGQNFTRTMLQPIPNMADATVYRIVGRYRAVVAKDGTIYRR